MGASPLPLLRILADGECHSASRLCAALGLSRGALRSRRQAAAALDLPVFGVRGRGYRLRRPLDLIDADALDRRLRAAGAPLALALLDECASTNSELVRRAAAGAPHGAVLACEYQSAGRGRRGNAWLAPIGGSLAFSVLWRFARDARGLSGLSLAVAVAAAEGLERAGARDIQLKWPNDLVCAGGKLGGILIEVSADAPGASAAVIGMGINVRLDPATHAGLGQPVADLASCGGAPPRRTDLLAGLLASLAAALDQFAREGFAPFRDAWVARHIWQGRRVALSVAGRRIAEGEATGIAEDGALVLRSAGGLLRFHSGELSLRSA